MDAFPRVHWQCRIAFFDPSADHALYPHRLVEQKHMRQTAAALLECGLIQMQQRIAKSDGWALPHAEAIHSARLAKCCNSARASLFSASLPISSATAMVR